MTEAEWESSVDPDEMYEALPLPEFRRLLLFACGCLRLIAQAPNSLINVDEVTRSERACDEPSLDFSEETWDIPLNRRLVSDAKLAVENTLYLFEAEGLGQDLDQKQHVVDLLRCIFGNPFRPAKYDPAWGKSLVCRPDWLTSTVREMAASVYESRDWWHLPILADALQDAGCEDELVLSHLRGPGPHARGCWVLDLILGKA